MRVHIFGDEAGDLQFVPPGNGVSRYFMIGTVTIDDCSVGERLLALRRELVWEGRLLEEFHATKDKQYVRDRVIGLLAAEDIRFDVTILDKRKAQDHLRSNPIRFYKQAWYLHLKHVAPSVATSEDELLVMASSLQIKKKVQAVGQAVEEVVRQVTPTTASHYAFFPAKTDPCLQAADYLTWAIQRKYERDDDRSYDQIKHLIASEFEPFAYGTKLYY